MEDEQTYIFIIDTDKYAGNFEREMTAYITGIVGDCGVGEECAQEFLKDYNIEEAYDGLFGENISLEADEHGCGRPTKMWTDNDGEYNSVAIFFCETISNKQIGVLKERARSYAKKQDIMIKGFRLLNKETIIKELKNWRSE